MKKILIALLLINSISIFSVSATDYTQYGGSVGSSIYFEANSETAQTTLNHTWCYDGYAPITLVCTTTANDPEDNGFSYEITLPLNVGGYDYPGGYMISYDSAYDYNQTFYFDMIPGDINIWGYNYHTFSGIYIYW